MPPHAHAFGDLVFTECRRGSPCPVCGRDHHCSHYTGEGKDGKGVEGAKCMWAFVKSEAPRPAPAGWTLVKVTKDGGYLYQRGEHAGIDLKAIEARRKKAEHWEKKSKEMAKRLWLEARANTRHPRVAAYLAARGIDVEALPGGLHGLTRALGFVPRCVGKKHDPNGGKEGKVQVGPAMVAAVVDAAGKVTGVHRTFLDPKGDPKKWDEAAHGAAKQMLGACGGRAIRLYDPTHAAIEGEKKTAIILGEGIETVGACVAATGIAGWACLSASGVASVELPAWLFGRTDESCGGFEPLVSTVIIAADLNTPGRGHEHGVGEESARVLANRLLTLRPWLQVVVRTPPPTPTHLSPALAHVPTDGKWKGKCVGVGVDEDGKPEGVDWLNVSNAHGAAVVRDQLLEGVDLAAAAARAKAQGREVELEDVEISAAAEAYGGDLARDPEGGTGGDGNDSGGGGGRFGDGAGGDGSGGDGGGDSPWVLPPLERRPIVGDDSLERARKWLWQRARLAGATRFTVVWWADAWWIWADGRYVKMADKEMEARVRPWLAGHARLRQLVRGDELEPVNPTTRQVGDMLDAMRSETWARVTQMPARLPATLRVDSGGGHTPLWGVATDESTLRLRRWNEREENAFLGRVVLANGVLDINEVAKTGRVELKPHSPDYFTATCLPFELPVERLQELLDRNGADAGGILETLCPYWMEWLDDASGGDAAWQGQLQEMVGDTVSGDRTIEKVYMVVGVQRAGKGIIEDAVRAIVGEENVVSPLLSMLAEDRFAAASLVGKSVAYIPDAHLPSTGHGAMITELLKTISGNGGVTIRDLHSKAQTLKLGTRIWISCNNEPDLRDDSAAFADRLIVLPMQRSALGRENPEYKRAIPREAPGILLWALLGAIRLARKPVRRIDVCMGGREVSEEYRELSAHVQTFVNECLVRVSSDLGGRETIADWYKVYAYWCEHVLAREPYGPPRFARSIKWVTQHTYTQPRTGESKRTRLIKGWNLKDEWRHVVRGGDAGDQLNIPS